MLETEHKPIGLGSDALPLLHDSSPRSTLIACPVPGGYQLDENMRACIYIGKEDMVAPIHPLNFRIGRLPHSLLSVAHHAFPFIYLN